jgi:hypothetical protein
VVVRALSRGVDAAGFRVYMEGAVSPKREVNNQMDQLYRPRGRALALGAALGLTALALPAGASAGPLPGNAYYRGKTSDGARITLQTSRGGTRVRIYSTRLAVHCAGPTGTTFRPDTYIGGSDVASAARVKRGGRFSREWKVDGYGQGEDVNSFSWNGKLNKRGGSGALKTSYIFTKISYFPAGTDLFHCANNVKWAVKRVKRP